MNPRKTNLVSSACVLLGTITMAARADVLVSNLAEPERAFNVIAPSDWATQSFDTDEFAHMLSSIEAIVGNEIGPSGAFAQLRASDLNGNMVETPDGVLATFTVPDLTGPRSARAFIPDGSVMLEPATRYYFVLGASIDGTFEWSYAEGNGQVGPGTLAQYEYSFDAGKTWTIFGSDNPFHMAVNVDAVPPPACEGDADRDGDRDFADITSVLANWLATYTPGSAGKGDANDDGEVNFADVTAVLSFFDIPCP